MKISTKKERDPGSRWTPELIKGGWTPIADVFLEHYADLVPPITSLEAMLVIQLLQHKWDKSAPFPAFKTLAKRMGMSDASARSHARSLSRKGYLAREMRKAQTNRFYLDPLFKKLEEYVAAHPRPKREEVKFNPFAAA